MGERRSNISKKDNLPGMLFSVPTENIFNYFLGIKDKPDTWPPVITLRMCLHCNWRCASSTSRCSTAVKRGQLHWCQCRLMAHTCAVSSGFAQLIQPLSSPAGWLRTLISAYTWHASQKLQSCLWWLNKCSLKSCIYWRTKFCKKEWEGTGIPRPFSAAAWEMPSSLLYEQCTLLPGANTAESSKPTAPTRFPREHIPHF